MTILLVVGILGFLIVIHEVGHFLAAKIFGVRVEEFGVGYPPRAFTFGKWGDTEYTLNWILFGGFVRLFGDVGAGQHGRGSFVDKGRGVQAAILVAGVFMNMVAAWGLFFGAFSLGVPRVVDEVTPGTRQWLLIAEVVPGSPAAAAGIVAGDQLVDVSGTRGEKPEALTPEAVTNFVRARAGEAIEFSYLRAGVTSTVTVRPAHAIIPDAAEQPAVGFSLVMVSTEPLPPLEAAKEASLNTWNAFGAVGGGLWGMAKDAFNGKPALQNIVGPIGLVGVVGQAAETGMGNVLALAAFISVNLVIINLLPIPALDGGRLFVLGVEAVIRRDVSRLALRLLSAFGIAFIIFLMVTVTYNDIVRLLA